MNQIITSNRQKISTHINNCFSALGKYLKAVDAFHQERNRITGLPFIQEEKERMVAKAAQSLAENAQTQYTAISGELKGIGAAAAEMEQLLDIGQDLQNALAVVKYGSAIPVATRLQLVDTFRGQPQALTILKAAFEAAGLDPEHYFKGLIFKADDQVQRLDELAYQIVVQPGENALVAVNFSNELEKFAASIGAELTARFSDMTDATEVFNAAYRSAFGLGTAD